jgi:hypothetical protein
MSPIQSQRPSPTRSLRVMLTALALTVSGLTAGAFTPATAAAQNNDAREDFRWQGQIQPGQNVEIRGVNGSVDAEPSTSGQVEVSAIKTGNKSDPRAVRIVVVPHAEGVTVCALYPDIDGEPNECKPGGGRNSTRDNDVNVQFTIRVPAGASFTGRTVNGNIDARGLDGRVSLHTVNGNVDISTASYASVKTVNGSITARLGRADWQDALEMKTVNGSITVHLPASVATDVNAKTVSGRILSDFPITIQEAGRRSLKGTIGGGGGRALALETVNGSITLKSGD